MVERWFEKNWKRKPDVQEWKHTDCFPQNLRRKNKTHPFQLLFSAIRNTAAASEPGVLLQGAARTVPLSPPFFTAHRRHSQRFPSAPAKRIGAEPVQPLTADRFRRGRVGASAGCAARGRSVPAASGTRGARPKGPLCSRAAGPGGSGRRGS